MVGRRVRALVAVLVLGGGAGVGAMLGLWAGMAWWVARTAPDDGSSLLSALGAGAVGVVAGGLAGVCLAAVVVVLVAGLRRQGAAEDEPGHPSGPTPVQEAGPGPDQSRSS